MSDNTEQIEKEMSCESAPEVPDGTETLETFEVSDASEAPVAPEVSESCEVCETSESSEASDVSATSAANTTPDTRIAPGVENTVQAKPRMRARSVAAFMSVCVVAVTLIAVACFAVAQTNAAGLFTTTVQEITTDGQDVDAHNLAEEESLVADKGADALEKENTPDAQGSDEASADATSGTQESSGVSGQRSYSSNSSNESSSSGHAGRLHESHASDTASDGSSEDASSGADTTGSTDAPSDSQGDTSQTSSITVSVSVSSDAADSSVSASVRTQFSQGASALDALYATGLSVNVKQTSYGAYVVAIGGLAEKDFGSASGWMYAVNGKVPMTACSKYQLCDGDVVTWYYVA